MRKYTVIWVGVSRSFLSFIFCYCTVGTFAQSKTFYPEKAIISTSDKKISALNNNTFGTQSCFIENIGQYGSGPEQYNFMGGIQFGFAGFGMPVFFTEKGLIFLQSDANQLSEKEREKLAKAEVNNKTLNSTKVLTIQWLGSNEHPQIITSEKTNAYYTFGMLHDKARGFKRITCKEVYPGIDITYYFNPGNAKGFEYKITLQPGADLSKVKMKYDGDLSKIKILKNGAIGIKMETGGFEHSVPVGFYENDTSNKFPFFYKVQNNIISFGTNESYDTKKVVVIDPFISSTSNLLGLNAGKAKDIDYDYAGNLYVSGGGDGATNHMLAKYDAGGTLLWTFSGILPSPSWQFGTYYGGWVVEKTTGNVYLGQGFEYTNGFSVIRLNTAGIYDNYITTANPNFREDWKMYWMCNNGSPQILIAGGGTNSNTNFGICTPPSPTITSLNITGIPYSSSTGWAQDISDIVIDPVNNDMYTIYGSLYGTPLLSNQIYKNKAPYSAASLDWNLYSGFVAIQEIANRPFLSGGNIDNSSNVLAINSSYFYYWDGKNLKAFDKTTGATAGTPLTIAGNLNLMSGGIVVDECNNVFVGATNGTIKVYKFNGSLFDDAAAPDITIPGYGSKSVYDLAYNEPQKLLYASGDGFIASFDITSYGCPSTIYNINVNANCALGTATVTLSPAPPIGSTITYILYDGNTQIASNATGIFSGLSAGITYTVKVFVNQICSGVLTITNFVLPGPILSLTKTDATCGNNTGSITASGSGSSGPFTYSKDGITYQGSGVFSGLLAGLYIINVKDAGGCKTTDSIIIKNTNGPSLSFTKTDATCSNNDGTITASGSGGLAPLQFSINGSTFQNNTLFTGLTAGNYTLTVKDAAGCTNVASVYIANYPGPQLTATPTSTTCNNNNGSIYAYGTGGTSPLEYSINGNIFQPGNFFNNMAAGLYTVTVRDANGCFKSTAVTVSSSPGPTVTAVATTASCNNINGSITATGTGTAVPLLYSINGSFFQSNNIFTGLAAGTYNITIKDANGCTNTTSVTINNSTGPVVSATATSASCNSNNGTITITSTGTAPFQYSLTGSIFQSSNIFSGLAAGNYIAYAKDAQGCISTAAITINNTAGPQLTVATSPASCSINDGTITATGTGGTPPLQFSIDGTTFQGSNIFSGLAEGNYTVTVKDANGCTKTATATIQNASGLTITATSISTTCAGNNGSITAFASGGVAPLQYSINGVTFQSSSTFIGLGAGSYTITAKDANGCLNTATTTVKASSDVTVTAITSNSCSNKNGSITASGLGGTAPLTYSINGTTFQTSGFFYGLTPNTYTVTVKDANGCTNTTSATISNVSGSGPTVTAKFHDGHSCSGDPQGRIDNIAGSGGTPPYLFSINGGPFSSTTTYFVPPGVYTVTVKDANGCTNTVKGTIIDLPAPTVTAIATSTPCGSSTGTIKATGHGGQTPYRYSLNGGPFQSSGTFSGLSAGTYTITVIDDESCIGSVKVEVLNTGGPALSTTKTDGTCGLSNGTITATGSGGTGTLKYSLNGGAFQNSGSFSGLAAGSYTITVKDGTGCTGGTTVIINNSGGPIISASTKSASCNSNNGNILVGISGGTPPIKYSLDGTIFQSSNLFTNLSPGNYTVTVLDAGGCFANTTVTVGKIAIPIVSAYTIAASCNNKDGSIVATGNSGTIPYVFSIDGINYQSINTFSGLAAGFYTVTIRDSNNCTNTTGITIKNISGPLLSLTALSSTCGSSNGSITAIGSGGTGPFQYSIDGLIFQSGNIFSGLTSATYTITVKDVNGCINESTILVGNLNGPQKLTAKAVNATCSNNNGSITATATGGSAPLQYSIDGIAFQTSNVFSGLSPKSYTVTVKDVNGCTKATSISVLDLTGPSASATAIATTCNKTDGVIVVKATGGKVPLQYSIDAITFQGSNLFTGLTAATYTITVKDANGCISSTAATVNNTSGATLTAAAVAASCGSANGTITATASGGTAPFQYSIDGITFQGSNVFSALPAATYTITVKDANGCISSTTATVNNTSGATLTAAAVAASCGSANGTITATASGGTAPFQYSIDGITFQGSNVFSGLSAATYTITVKDANGCISSTTTTVNNTSGATVTAAAVSASCGSANGTITATASGGTAPFQYSIDGITFQGSNVFSGPSAATYTITVKDANGCISSTTTTVNNTSGATLTAAAVAASCGSANGTITATASGGTAPFQYSIDGITFQGSNVFSGLSAATYTITVKDANGCISSTTATVGTISSVSASAGADLMICEGNTKQINASSTATTFLWQPDSWLNDASILNPYATPPVTTTYILTASTGTCIQKDTIIIYVNPLPIAVAGSDTTICQGNSLQLSGSGGVSYLWLPSTFLSNPYIQNPVVENPSVSISYILLVVDSNGCKSASADSIMVSVAPLPLVYAGKDTVILMDQPFQLNAEDIGSSRITSYSWSPSIRLNNSQIQSPIAILNQNTIYTVTASSAEGCKSTDDIAVTVFVGPDLYVPSAFTPNGDGLNDIFKPIPVGIKEFRYFSVFNRFGQLVYTTTSQMQGWDGTYKGKKQVSGTFVWQVEAIDFAGKIIFKKGTVVLIR